MTEHTNSILDAEFIARAQKKNRLLPFFLVLLLAVSGFSLTFTIAKYSKAATATAFVLSVQGEKDNVEVENGQAFTLQVEVLDESLQTLEDYDGSITVTSSDNNATLPSDYEFKVSDKGIKSFDLGLTLNSPGDQTITVMDVENPSVQGEITVTVLGAGGGSYDPDMPLILVPNDKTITNNNIVTISGTAVPNAEVTINDGTEEVGTVESNEDGEFIFNTEALFTGTHIFMVSTTNEEGRVLESNKVNVTVDDAAPVTLETVIDPETVAPGEIFRITVTAETGLLEINAILDDRSEGLVENPVDSGIYTGQIIAPAFSGEYPIDIQAVDQSSNEEIYEDQALLNVVVEEIPNQPPTASATFVPMSGASPLTVQFTSTSFDPDGQIVSYAWDFGDGSTSTEANPTHTYEFNAADGEDATMKYFVTLTVTDDGGLSSTAQAEAVGVEGQPVNYVEVLSQVGPAFWLLLIVSLIISFFVQKRFAFKKN